MIKIKVSIFLFVLIFTLILYGIGLVLPRKEKPKEQPNLMLQRNKFGGLLLILKLKFTGFISLPNHKTKVIFTECSEIGNPFIWVLSYLFFDLGATMDHYLIELAAKLGEKYQKDDF